MFISVEVDAADDKFALSLSCCLIVCNCNNLRSTLTFEVAVTVAPLFAQSVLTIGESSASVVVFGVTGDIGVCAYVLGEKAKPLERHGQLGQAIDEQGHVEVWGVFDKNGDVACGEERFGQVELNLIGT